MFRKTTDLKILETRRQLLLAESEVNRIELLREFDALKTAFKTETEKVKTQVRTFGSIASSAALLAAGISLFRRGAKPAESNGHSKMPWLAAAIEGARVGASLFSKIKLYLGDKR
jgi:hypothetical protein